MLRGVYGGPKGVVHNVSTGTSQFFLTLFRYALTMREWASRGIIALGIVATLGLSAPVLASAGSPRQVSSTSKGIHESDALYLAARHTIQVDFRNNVKQAKMTYQSSLAIATTSAQRSAARQVYEAAIIQAAATRSAALTALGPEPGTGKSTSVQAK